MDPCSDQIAKLQQVIARDAEEGLPFSGMGAQSIAAQLKRQPTPASVHQAEEEARAQVIYSLSQARTLSAQGKNQACKAAVAKTKLLLRP